MELQHVNVKLLVKNPEEVDLEPLIPIFHSWIHGKVFQELLLDVADYRHVQAGPGVVLIGLQGNYSVDNANHRLGVRYNRKAALEGNNQDRFVQAARAAATACQRLESEASMKGKLGFNGREVEIFINDRLLAPNREETRKAVEPGSPGRSSKELFRGSDYSLTFGSSDPRGLFGVSAKASRPFSSSNLLENLAQ